MRKTEGEIKRRERSKTKGEDEELGDKEEIKRETKVQTERWTEKRAC